MTPKFTIEQKIIIGLCGVTLLSNLCFQIERRKDKMKTENNFQIPAFLQRFSKGNTSTQQRGLRATTMVIDDICPLEESTCENTEESVDKKVEIEDKAIISHKAENREYTTMRNELTAHEREVIHDKLAGFDKLQMDAALEVIPVELMFNRIGKELQRNRAFAEAIKNALTILE